jgi:hypothetical protein
MHRYTQGRRSDRRFPSSDQEVGSVYLVSISTRNSILTICRFVEDKYRIEFGAAQTTQLSKAIARGEETGDFVLPKGKYPHIQVVRPVCGRIVYAAVFMSCAGVPVA